MIPTLTQPRSATLAASALIFVACGDATGPGDFDSRFSVTQCSSSLFGTTVGNLSVRPGNSCALEEVTVQGNVVVSEGGTLMLIGMRSSANSR